MNQVNRRQRKQLLPQELALLKSCGSEIRKTDYDALALAHDMRVRNTTSPGRLFKVHKALRALMKAIARWTRDMLKGDAAH